MSAAAPGRAVADRAAGIVTRALAATVDAVIVLAMMALALLAVAGIRFFVSPVAFQWPTPSWPVSLAVGALLAAGYLTIAWATSGRTCGAAVFGLRVRSISGGPLGWFRAFLRAGLCLAFPPGLLWCALSRRRCSLQDVVLRTVVVYDWRDDAGLPAAAAHPGVSPGTDGARRGVGGSPGRTPAKEAQP